MSAKGGAEGGIIHAVASALDLDTFLRRAVAYGVNALGCAGGSIYLVDGVSGSLRLCAHTYELEGAFCFDPGEGVVGAAFDEGEPRVFSGQDLDRCFVERGGQQAIERRAVAAVPVRYRDRVQAVACFDFSKQGRGASNGLDPSETQQFNALAEELGSARFGNALRRMRASQARLGVRNAGTGPARLRQAVVQYLTALRDAFAEQGKTPPDLAYLELVDRRRGTIRTVQGVGLPLSFQTSACHSLDSDDVQAYVVRNPTPLIIVGRDRLLDPAVFERFHHDEFVRLWLPLFPFPRERLVFRPHRPIEEVMAELLDWGDVKRTNGGGLRLDATWRKALRPPSELVYGTLELGYRRKNESQTDLDCMTPELASWCAAQAYSLEHLLFPCTLAGSLESIARGVADLVWPASTRLTVAMPDWRTPESRSYPGSSDWPAAIPEKGPPVTPPPKWPAIVELDGGDTGAADASHRRELHALLTSVAEEAVRVAFMLDDQAADLYTLAEEREKHLATAFPDPRLGEILQEICREAAAERCTYFLFDEAGGELEPLGPSVPWPGPGPAARVDPQERELARQVAGTRKPAYRTWSPDVRSWPVAALPLELAEASCVVVLLHYSPGTDISEAWRRELEGRAARWVYRLSLRHLSVAARFHTQMRKARNEVGEARRLASASEDSCHFGHLAERLLLRIAAATGARATVLTSFPERDTEPLMVERFWCCGETTNAALSVDSHVFVRSSRMGACERALRKGNPVYYPPGDPDRARDTKAVCLELLERAKKIEAHASPRARRLRRLVALVSERDEPCTMTVIPLAGGAGSGEQTEGALILLLPGQHELSARNRDLLLELGRLTAEALSHGRSLDTAAFGSVLDQRLETLTQELARAETPDEVVGVLLESVAVPGPGAAATPNATNRWELSEHAVVWLLTPGFRELVVCSMRGSASKVLANTLIIEPGRHPLLSREASQRPVPAKGYPRLDRFRVWSIRLSELGDHPLRGAYEALLGCNWLVSFPLWHADNRVIGVVDCPRASPLRPDVEPALVRGLQRLSLQVCAALDRCRSEHGTQIRQLLAQKTSESLEQLQAHEAYQILVSRVRDEFGAGHCDLLLDRDGSMLLYATTRLEDPISESARQDYCLQPKPGDDVLGATLHARAPRQAHGSSNPSDLGHTSDALKALLDKDYEQERLALPLRQAASPDVPVLGLLHIRGPFGARHASRTERVIKRSGILTPEDRKLAEDVAREAYGIATTARLVESKAWLIDELQHQLGQPLQNLRGWCDDALRKLHELRIPSHESTTRASTLERAFDLVHDVRNQLAAYARMSQAVDFADLGEVDLKSLVAECCSLMEFSAQQKACSIERGLDSVEPAWGHRALLRAAILNLLDNAIKYSYEKRTVAVTLDGDSDRVVLSVQNFGIGIPEVDLPRIFEPHFRSRVPDAKGERRGSGIGLAIVRHAIELVHRGNVQVSSEPPRGMAPGHTARQTASFPHTTTFTVTLNRDRLESLRGSPGPAR